MCPTDDTAVSGTACLPACQVQAILNIATGMIALKSRSDYYVTPLLKTFRWLFISIMVKAQILTMTKASLNLTPPSTVFSLASSPITLPLAHFSPTTLTPLLFLEHARHTSTLAPLCWLFPLPGMLFLHISIWLFITFKPWFKCLLYSDHYLKLQFQQPLSHL